MDEDSAVSITIPEGTFTDATSDTLLLSARLVGGDPLPAWLGFDGTQLIGTPPLNFNGALDIEIVASDGELTASDQFTLTIDPVNDAPELAIGLLDATVDGALPIDLAVNPASFTDVDGDDLVLTAQLVGGDPLPAWLVFDGTGFTGTAPEDFAGTLQIEVTASDGNLSAADVFALTVEQAGDDNVAPVLAVPLDDVSVNEDSAVSISVPAGTFTDADDDALVLTARLAGGDPLPAWLSFDGSQLTGTPPLNFNGALDIEIVASDGEFTASDLFTLTIDPVNDAPVAVDDGPFIVTGDGLTLAGSALLANDSDVDGDSPFIVSVGAASAGTVSLELDGSVVISGLTGISGLVTFSYTISDGTLESSANVTVQAGVVVDPYADFVQGTPGDDTMNGGGNVPNKLYGAAGDDIIKGRGFDDILVGGAGDDLLKGRNGDDQLWGGEGDDLLLGWRRAGYGIFCRLLCQLRDFPDRQWQHCRNGSRPWR